MPRRVSPPIVFGILAIILVLSLGVANIRRWGASETTTLSASLLLLAFPATFLTKPPYRWFWLGFGLFGAVYLAVSIASPWGEHLPTSAFLDRLQEWSSPRPRTRDIDDFGESRRRAENEKASFRRAGHSLLSLLVGLMGGALALSCIRSQRENSRPEPPEGSRLEEGWSDKVRL